MAELFDKNLLLRAGFKHTHHPCIEDVSPEDEYNFTAPNMEHLSVSLYKGMHRETKVVFDEYVYVDLGNGNECIVSGCATPAQLEALVFALFNLKISLQ